jgi:antitoxin VapB
MALNIKDPETERLAAQLAELTGQTKTGVIRAALREQFERLSARDDKDQRRERFLRFLREEVWPQVPDEVRGQKISKAEREDILGFGPEGV